MPGNLAQEERGEDFPDTNGYDLDTFMLGGRFVCFAFMDTTDTSLNLVLFQIYGYQWIQMDTCMLGAIFGPKIIQT